MPNARTCSSFLEIETLFVYWGPHECPNMQQQKSNVSLIYVNAIN
jgi:hypothetical protein